VQKSLVIEFISTYKQICTIKIDIKRKSGFINKKYTHDKYEKKLKNKLAKKSYIKMLYEKNSWIKDKYQRNVIFIYISAFFCSAPKRPKFFKHRDKEDAHAKKGVGYFCSVHIRLVVDGAGRNQYHA
jgi:hypothetical protein